MDTAAGISLRERKKLTTRQALSQAALRLAVERGPGAVRREDIAAAVDVSLRTFNNYFSSREEAIVALAVDRAAQVAIALRDRPACEPIADALTAAFLGRYSGAARPDKAWLAQITLIVTAPELQAEFLKASTVIEASLAAVIAERTGADVRRDLHPRVLAAAACAAERVAIGFWLDSGASRRLADVLREALEQVLAGTGKERRRPGGRRSARP
jgi:AcrR family transcriptional regulator